MGCILVFNICKHPVLVKTQLLIVLKIVILVLR